MKYAIEITQWDTHKQEGIAVSSQTEHGDISVVASSFMNATGLARAKVGMRYEAEVVRLPDGHCTAIQIEDKIL